MLGTFKADFSKKILVSGFLAIQLLAGGHVLASNVISPFKAHSLKKLDVAGAEMVLLQLFLKNGNLTVVSKDDHIGVSQKNDLVSFYMDYERTHPAIKEVLSKKSYIRDKDKLNKLLTSVFSYKEASERNDEVISIKLKP